MYFPLNLRLATAKYFPACSSQIGVTRRRKEGTMGRKGSHVAQTTDSKRASSSLPLRLVRVRVPHPRRNLRRRYAHVL